MKDFKNNFLNFPVYNKPQDYFKVSEEMASIHSLCFKNSKNHLSQKVCIIILRKEKPTCFITKLA